MAGRFLIHVIAWLPVAFLAWLGAPFVIPEAWRAESTGYYLVTLLHTAIICAVLFLAGRAAQKEVAERIGALRGLVLGLLYLAAMLLSFLWGALLPTREVTRRCHDGPIGGSVCERYAGGFAPDIPFYRLQVGRITPGACPATLTSTLSWNLGSEDRALHPAPCPAGLLGAQCYEERWAGSSSGEMVLFVAFDAECERGLELYGRGRVALSRRDRLGAP